MASRSKKLMVVGVILLSMLAGCLGFLLVYSARIKGGVQKRLQAIRETGAPTAITELSFDSVPDDENAAALLELAYPKVSGASKAIAERFESLSSEPRAATVGFTDEQKQQLLEFRDNHPEMVALLRQAIDAPGYAPVIDLQTPLFAVGIRQTEKLNDFSTAWRALSLIIKADIAEAGTEKGLNEWVDVLELVSGVEKEPVMTSFLTAQQHVFRTASEVNTLLRAHNFKPETYQRLDSVLDSLDTHDPLVRALEMERAHGITQFEELVNVVPKGLRWLGRVNWSEEEIRYLDVFDEQLLLAREPYFDVVDQISGSIPMKYMGEMIRPALEQMREAFERRIATIRCLRIVTHISEKQLQSDTQLSLESLDLAPEAVVDPFSGKPLKLKRTDDGWIVYSVGKDLNDDGGDVDDKDIGLK